MHVHVLQPPVGTATVKGDIAAGHAIIIGGKAYIVRLVDGASVYVIEESTGIAPDADVDAVAYKIVRPQIRAEKRFTISQSGGFTSDASGTVLTGTLQFEGVDNQKLNWLVVV